MSTIRTLTVSAQEARENIVNIINDEANDYNKVLNGNFVGLYCLNSWFDVKCNEKNELVDFELTRLRTQFLIKIKKILARLRFPNFIVMNALYFLDLVRDYIKNFDESGLPEEDEYPVFYKTKEDNLFLNFVVCLMVSNKSSNDFAMKAKYWSRLTKIPIRKINELELVLLNNILKHHPLTLNFNVAKLTKFNDQLQSKILPFNNYIEDFNAKFNSTYNKPATTVAATTALPTPSPSPKPAYESSPASSTSPTSSYTTEEHSSVSSYSPPSANSSMYSVGDNNSQIQIQTIDTTIRSLENYIHTPTTNFKRPEKSHSASFYHASLPNPYNYINFDSEKTEKVSAYREQYYSLEVQE